MNALVAGARRKEVGTLVVPALVLAVLVVIIVGQAGLPLLSGAGAAMASPATVVIAPRPYAYRAGGDYLRAGNPVDGPLIEVADPPPLEIMIHEVGAADYAICVAQGGCAAAEPKRRGLGNVPATGVSFADAEAYARWLSAATGDSWRLPTLAEWVFAAGEQAVDPALLLDGDGSNPAARWLALYSRESGAGDDAPAAVLARGDAGTNRLGVADMAGPVWEWTSTCNSRTLLDAAGTVLSRVESCGVRLLEGRHRAAMSYFVRDARGGGCTAGVPPDNLGFRLVREPGGLDGRG